MPQNWPLGADSGGVKIKHTRLISSDRVQAVEFLHGEPSLGTYLDVP